MLWKLLSRLQDALEEPSVPTAELGIMCQQMSVGKRQKAKVALTLGTGVKAETGFPVPDSGLLQSLGIILVRQDRPRLIPQTTKDAFYLTALA